MVSFGELPEDCVSNIISRTSPRDACRASSISWGFKSAADSDATWEQFFPSDYLEILSGSAAPVVFSTKKELYLRLVQSHILLDGGKMSFSVGKDSGKKCHMVGARQLAIDSADDLQCWKWTSSPHSRFSEVAELLNVRRLYIRGNFDTRLLSKKTTYVVYFVFKFSKGSTQGRGSAYTSISYVNERENVDGPRYRKLLMLGRRRRKDRWMEIETGQFFNDCGDDGEVEIWFAGFQFEKFGLIIEGFEFRPKHDAK